MATTALTCACSPGTAQEPSIPDLTGKWVQSNTGDSSTYHKAAITEDTIEIYWVNDDDETKSLYWAGTFVAPTDDAEPYKWSSTNDTKKTEYALLASNDESKDFTYENKEITYEASALGMTKTVHLKKEK